MVRFRQKALISFNFEEKKHLIRTTIFGCKILARLVDQNFLFIKFWLKIEEIDCFMIYFRFLTEMVFS